MDKTWTLLNFYTVFSHYNIECIKIGHTFLNESKLAVTPTMLES